eukprot:m.352156 g.352156  ORF g.352156 m.352156 type:complete len:483 (+) comp16455_c0_seq1:487-1935(+)
MLDESVCWANKLKDKVAWCASVGCKAISVHCPVTSLGLEVVPAVLLLNNKEVTDRLVALDTARGTLKTHEAVLATEKEAWAVNDGKGEESGWLRTVTGGEECAVWLAVDVLASRNRSEADTVLLGVVNGELARLVNGLSVTSDSAIATEGPVLAGVGEEGDGAVCVDNELEAFLVGGLTLLVSLDLGTVTSRDELAAAVSDDKLWLGVLNGKELLLGDLLALHLEGTGGTVAGKVLTSLTAECDLVFLEGEEEHAVSGWSINKLSVALKVLSVACHDTVATCWVVSKEDEVQESVISPWNVLVALKLTVGKVDVALAHDTKQVDLWVHCKVGDPLAVSRWGLDWVALAIKGHLGEGAQLGASAVEVVASSGDQTPSTVVLWDNLPSGLGGLALGVTLDLAVTVAVKVLALWGLEEDLAIVTSLEGEDLFLAHGGATAVDGIAKGLEGEVLAVGGVTETKSPDNWSHCVRLCVQQAVHRRKKK